LVVHGCLGKNKIRVSVTYKAVWQI